MFGFLSRQKTQRQETVSEANALYSAAMAQSRKPVFYTDYGVADSFEGRFDLLLLHLFFIQHRFVGRPEKEHLAQALFDATFRNMDQTLREVGIGDMGVPKRMRRMMKAFNGRMHVYEAAVAPEKLEGVKIEGLKKTTLRDALMRNLYAEKVDEEVLVRMENYVLQNLKNMEIVEGGSVRFVE